MAARTVLSLCKHTLADNPRSDRWIGLRTTCNTEYANARICVTTVSLRKSKVVEVHTKATITASTKVRVSTYIGVFDAGRRGEGPTIIPIEPIKQTSLSVHPHQNKQNRNSWRYRSGRDDHPRNGIGILEVRSNSWRRWPRTHDLDLARIHRGGLNRDSR